METMLNSPLSCSKREKVTDYYLLRKNSKPTPEICNGLRLISIHPESVSRESGRNFPSSNANLTILASQIGSAGKSSGLPRSSLKHESRIVCFG